MGKLLREEVVNVLSTKIRFADTKASTDNLRAYCPFHKDGQERTPSLYVYVGPKRSTKKSPGSAFCQACGEGWSFNRLVKKLGMNRHVIDAVNEIARATASLDKEAHDQLNFDLTPVPEMVLGVFDWAPSRLIKEGFSKKILKEFDIGFDKERMRITFPLRDHHGNLVAISGRNVGPGKYARYKIYKEELREVVPGYDFHKARMVWGLDRFYRTAMEVGLTTPVAICEGFKAAMWTVQHGFDTAVALIGTHCSAEQKTLICRVTNEVILFQDNDKPGIKSTNKLIPLFDNDVDVSIANYPIDSFGLSPDDLDQEAITTALYNPISKYQWRKRYANIIC